MIGGGLTADEVSLLAQERGSGFWQQHPAL